MSFLVKRTSEIYKLIDTRQEGAAVCAWRRRTEAEWMNLFHYAKALFDFLQFKFVVKFLIRLRRGNNHSPPFFVPELKCCVYDESIKLINNNIRRLLPFICWHPYILPTGSSEARPETQKTANAYLPLLLYILKQGLREPPLHILRIGVIYYISHTMFDWQPQKNWSIHLSLSTRL